MAVLTTMAGIPLYSSIQEALTWGATKGLKGYHIHVYKGQNGYMGGVTHYSSINNIKKPLQPLAKKSTPPQQRVTTTPVVNTRPSQTQTPRPTGGGRSGGGGGY